MTTLSRVLFAVVAVACTSGVGALRCNGQEDNPNCGSDDMPESFCSANVFSASLNEKLTEYTRQMCPVMCGTCQTTTSTTTIHTTWAPTEAVKVTPKQSVAIIGLCFAPLLVVALACYYKEERIPMTVMKHVMSDSLEVAINRRLHAEKRGVAGEHHHRGPVRASIDGELKKPAPIPAPVRSRNSAASVSNVESGEDVSSDPARSGQSQERISGSLSPSVRASQGGVNRPSFDYAKPRGSKSVSPDMVRPSFRNSRAPTLTAAHPGGAAHEIASLPPSKPKILG